MLPRLTTTGPLTLFNSSTFQLLFGAFPERAEFSTILFNSSTFQLLFGILSALAVSKSQNHEDTKNDEQAETKVHPCKKTF